MTTILVVRRNGEVALAGDGQVTVGDHVMKARARKSRILGNGAVVAGFAGSVADALTLFDKFEGQLEKHQNNLRRAAVELSKDWRTDRVLRRLEAQLVVGDANDILMVSGDGDVIEPDGDSLAIGSGGTYAQAAAVALLQNTPLAAHEIAQRALEIAADLCIYTNREITLLRLPAKTEQPE